MAPSTLNKFFDLGFYPERADRKLPLQLGGSPKTKPPWSNLSWQIGAWLLVALGIFARQGMQFPPIAWKITQLTWGAFLGSVIIGLAVFPWFMRRVNKKRPRPGLEHVALPFAFGFFLDLTTVATFSAFKLLPFSR